MAFENSLGEFRVERDIMGEMRVPSAAYYGAQTARAVVNFPISGIRFPRRFIRALGLIKKHAALTNANLGLIDAAMARAIQQSTDEVASGKWDEQFVVDIFQSGSGTSTNMNANEVIAHRATELLGETGGGTKVHPNDHVNKGQSSNDVIPSAINLAAFEGIQHALIPALTALRAHLQKKAEAFADIIKIGRTHFQDATPISLGQEFSGYVSQIEHGMERLRATEERLGALALGGTAVGTGLNAHPEFAKRTIEALAAETNLPLRETANHFEAQSARDVCVELSGALKTNAVSLIKIASDIRFLASGPRTGIGELKLLATQPGSSIMPGKINPVMCEMLIQVGAQVIGNDAAVTLGGILGNLELNVMMPLIAHNLLQSLEILSNAARVFGERCIAGLEVDRQRCESNVERSLAMCTTLAPTIVYDMAAEIANRAYETNRNVREVAEEISGIEKSKLTDLLDPKKQARPD